MNIFDLSAKITLDTAEYRAQVEQAKEEIKEAEKGMKDAGKQSETLKNKLSFLTQQYKAARETVDNLTKAYNESKRKTGALSSETVDLAKRLDSAEKEARELKSTLDQYTATTGKASTQTKKDTSDMEDSWNGFGATVIGVIVGIVTAASSAIVSLGKIGLQFNTSIESYTTNFETMLGSAEAAAAKVEQLREMAAATPFGLADLADATQTLLAFDIEAENTEKILQMIGDASLGDSQKMQSLTLAFSQATSAGKLMGQDWLQMINAGFNPLQQIAEATGLSVGQLKEIMGGASEEALETMRSLKGVTEYGQQIIDQGYISADDLYRALEIATSEGGQFFQGMERSSKTLSGLLSTLKDDADSLLGLATSPLFEFIKGDVLPGAGDLVQAITNMLNGNGSASEVAEIGSNLLIGIMNGIADGAANLVDPLVDAVDNIVNKIPIDKLAAVGGKLIGSLIQSATKLIRSASGIAWQSVPALISAIPVFLSELLGQVDFGLILKVFSQQISDQTMGVLPEIVGAIAVIAPQLVEIILDTLSANAPSLITAGVNISYSIFSAITQSVIELIKSGIPAIANTLINAVYGLGELLFSSVKGLLQNVAKIPNTISEIFNGNKTIDQAIEGFKDLFAGGYDPVVALDFAGEWVSSNKPTFSWNDGLTTPTDGVKLSDYTPTTIGDVSVNVNVPNTNATPEEIGDAVAEAISIALGEVSSRKAAAYGR